MNTDTPLSSITEKQKMLAGQLFLSSDPELVGDRLWARTLMQQYNASASDETVLRRNLLNQLFGSVGDDACSIEPTFRCDYGYNIHVGKRFQANFDCTILDISSVTFGDDCLVGPGVHIYTVTHPMEADLRASGVEYGNPVSIGNNVWICGRALITPGVCIGNNVVIAAGSVVIHNVPDNVLVAGNPAQVKGSAAGRPGSRERMF